MCDARIGDWRVAEMVYVIDDDVPHETPVAVSDAAPKIVAVIGCQGSVVVLEEIPDMNTTNAMLVRAPRPNVALNRPPRVATRLPP
jgi:hypothetical protein